MSHSTARASAVLRSRFTGEHAYTARAGLGRGGAIGLDDCTPAQARLRALLAIGWFNSGRLAAPGIDWEIGPTLNYGTDISPRRDHLVLIVTAAVNVADQLVDNVPGMRVERHVDWETVLLRHLPTDATLEITTRSQPRAVKPGQSLDRRGMRPSTQVPLTEAEVEALDLMPSMSQDVCRLLGALAVRASLRDPDGKWHVDWYHDRLHRQSKHGWNAARRLWGHGDVWSLEWTSYPYAEDLVASLTDPRCSLPGLTMKESRRGWALAFGRAELHLLDREARLR